MKRAGFTMIELIFVIVILGILAAVAIPKLAATRDDAKISTIVANAATVFSDAASYYTSQGSVTWAGGSGTDATWSELTNVQLYTAAGTVADGTAISQEAFLYTDGSTNAEQVLGFVAAADGNFTIQQGSGTNTVSTGVQGVDSVNIMTNGATDRTHEFGGTGIVR